MASEARPDPILTPSPGHGANLAFSHVGDRLAHFLSKRPNFEAAAFIAPNATVLGDVRLGQGCSIWYQAVLRGDINFIEIGEATNIQDGAIVHLADDFPCVIGARVTVGHGAIVHACMVEDECLIGMRSTILDGSVIGRRSIVGAGAVVTGEMIVPPGSLVLGAPARVVRPLTVAEQEALPSWALKYCHVAAAHRSATAPAIA